MSQLNLLCSTRCDYCGRSETKPDNPDLFHGFRDADNGKIVCSSCRKLHYIHKAHAAGTLVTKGKKYLISAMTYSEVPIMAIIK